MKIAVIGASGNAGSRISAELARRGHSVTAIVRNPERVTAQVNVTPTRGDVTDQAGLARLLTGHDAAISSVRFLASDPVKLIAAARESKSIWSSATRGGPRRESGSTCSALRCERSVASG